ncbi:hypothetical protein Tco_1552609, partial [Tanacetum coccineum]
GSIPGMRSAQALTAIQTMADHSQKWHDGTTSRNIKSSNSKVGCKICEGPHLDKDCPLNEEVKQGEERQSLEELLAKHQEESAQRSTEMEGWIKKLQENA